MGSFEALRFIIAEQNSSPTFAATVTSCFNTAFDSVQYQVRNGQLTTNTEVQYSFMGFLVRNLENSFITIVYVIPYFTPPLVDNFTGQMDPLFNPDSPQYVPSGKAKAKSNPTQSSPNPGCTTTN